MNTNTTIPMQRLLQHRQWVRNLARTLVLDEARADDLEQQTWLAAIERPPTGDTPKAWLGTVMRNLAGRMRRSEFRVDRREGVAARPERLPATSDVVAQAELHKQVVQAVLDLDEPYRETVLLRHYEGLAPRQVAERMGVPVETVRSRVRRGLQQVRRRLDAQHGGDGHAWKLALLPLARLADGAGAAAGGAAAATTTASAGSAGAMTGALLMSAQSKITAAVLALVLLAGGAWYLFDDGRPDDDAPTVLEVGETPTDDAGPTLEARGAPKTAPTAPAERDTNDPVPPPPPMPQGAAWVRVVRGEGDAAQGVKGAGVIVAGTKGTTHDVQADRWGRATLPESALGFPTSLWILDEATGSVERRRATLGEGEFLVRLPAPAVVELVFQDGLGGTVSAAEVKERFERSGIRPRAYLVSGEALSANDMSVLLETMLGLSTGTSFEVPIVFGEDSVRLALAPSAGRWQLLMDRPRLAPDISDPFQVATDGSAIRVTMRFPPDGMAHLVKVVDAGGTPLAGATITPWFEIGDDAAFFPGAPRTTNDEGVVKLPLLDTEGRPGQRAPTWWVSHETKIAMISPHVLNKGTDKDPVVVTAYEPAVVEGRAWTPTGAWAVGRTVLFARKGYRRRTQVGPDGRYRLTGIPAGKQSSGELWIIDDLPKAQLRQATVEFTSGETTTHDFGAPVVASDVATIAGRITEDGRPLQGVLVMAQGQALRGKGRTATTDAEGRYALEGIPPGAFRVLAVLGDFRVSDDFGVLMKEAVTLDGGQEVTYDFDLPGGHVELVILDAETGKPVPGAIAIARPQNREHGVDRFEGFRAKLGWGQAADEQGVVRLRALPTDVDLQVMFGTREGNYERGEKTDVRAGSPDAPTRIEIKLKKKP